MARPPCPSYAAAAMIPGEVSTAIVAVAVVVVLVFILLAVTSIVMWSIGDL